ncbi:hypothetical protein [Kribbella shirazensis]|uniref:DUF3592 domain-containing protein n=1 Tax=Kribbella shirazensis TaxID=1105143 RepID=A0A7X6A2N1_9ACTN|nr:hypothetical protein [Kribbella shirazensis]NIK59178.1 hypothetical protein [Kribbella shirazensis]
MSAVNHRSGELWVLMQARRLGVGRNPLRRPSDRLEAVLLWSVLLVALLMIPVGAAVGIGVRNSLEATAAHQRAALHEVGARTLESTERTVPSAPGDVLSRARVSYVDPQGIEREGTASVVVGTKPGVEVTIWLDRSGSIVAAPRSRSDSAAFGALAGFLIVPGAWLLLWGQFLLARLPLDRRRTRDWDAQWETVAPRWLHGQK